MLRPLKVHREVRKVNPNVIYDDTVVKYTINIPVDTYEHITRLCRERRIHRRKLTKKIRNILKRNAGSFKIQMFFGNIR